MSSFLSRITKILHVPFLIYMSQPLTQRPFSHATSPFRSLAALLRDNLAFDLQNYESAMEVQSTMHYEAYR